MNIENNLEQIWSDHSGLTLEKPANVKAIPKQSYMVYILSTCTGGEDEKAIVAGHGQKNRAKVIFDGINNKTTGHYKALLIRLYHIYKKDLTFNRYIIKCKDKSEAKEIEKKVHKAIGGNSAEIPECIKTELFKFDECSPSSFLASMVLKMALASSFDGLQDLKTWNKKGIFDKAVWEIIAKKLHL